MGATFRVDHINQLPPALRVVVDLLIDRGIQLEAEVGIEPASTALQELAFYYVSIACVFISRTSAECPFW
jgi:hypothetical protein